MNPAKALILTAVTMEARAVRLGLRGRESKIEDGGSIGIRARRLDSIRPTSELSVVILCGVAGALNPQLQVGDLVLDIPGDFALVDRLLQINGDFTAETQRRREFPEVGASFFSASLRLGGSKGFPQSLAPDCTDEPMRRGRIHTASEIAATPAAKAALFRSTGADAVDMEQAIVQQWCERRGLPLIGLRAISDTAGQSLDPAVLGFVDELGRPRAGRIATGLIRRPGLIRQLIRLNADSELALRQLAIGVRLVVDALR